ncbi:MAG: hypothetical protein EBT39_05135 [Sphingobacteriia bacterium]|nr:hypothetical protein [Candidatus Fonsibacter lacus]
MAPNKASFPILAWSLILVSNLESSRGFRSSSKEVLSSVAEFIFWSTLFELSTLFKLFTRLLWLSTGYVWALWSSRPALSKLSIWATSGLSPRSILIANQILFSSVVFSKNEFS